MRTIVLAALVAACIPRPAEADLGPPKHWATFPGRVVRAVSFRGDRFGREPSITVVQGRDGNVYLRGRFGLYRFREDGAEPPRVADTGGCADDAHGADLRPLVPVALCSRAQDIIVAAESWHRHIRVPYPDPAQPPYRFDGRELTDVVPAAGGGYWFAYGHQESVGRMWPSGRAALWRYPGLRTFYHVIAGGGDAVYALNDECRVVRLRARTMVTIAPEDAACRSYASGIVVTRDGTVWLLREHSVERRTAAGGQLRWTLPMFADDVAVTRDGTAYVLGSSARRWPIHPMIATIPSHGLPVVQTLPMQRAQSIAVDGRDRIWITDVHDDHAAAMISPLGASH